MAIASFLQLFFFGLWGSSGLLLESEKTHGIKRGSYHIYCGTTFEHRLQEEGIATAQIEFLFLQYRGVGKGKGKWVSD